MEVAAHVSRTIQKKIQELSIEIKTQYRILLILMTADNLNPWISSVQPASAMLPLAYGLPTFQVIQHLPLWKNSCRVVSCHQPYLDSKDSMSNSAFCREPKTSAGWIVFDLKSSRVMKWHPLKIRMDIKTNWELFKKIGSSWLFWIWFASSFFPAFDLLSVHKSEWILDFIILVDFKVLLPKSQAFVWSVESYIFLSIPSVVDSRRWFV